MGIDIGSATSKGVITRDGKLLAGIRKKVPILSDPAFWSGG